MMRTGRHFGPKLRQRLDTAPRKGNLIVTRDKPSRIRKVHLPWSRYYFGHRVAAIRSAAEWIKSLSSSDSRTAETSKVLKPADRCSASRAERTSDNRRAASRKQPRSSGSWAPEFEETQERRGIVYQNEATDDSSTSDVDGWRQPPVIRPTATSASPFTKARSEYRSTVSLLRLRGASGLQRREAKS